MTPHADGRDTRWAQHRARRRRELVEAALRAIRRHGPGVGMDDISAEAGTSKTVVYRHFGDRTGLYSAVAEAVDQRILNSLREVTNDRTLEDPIALVEPMVDAYLSLVEKDPEIYRFVVTRPLLDGPVEHDPVAGLSDQIGAQIATELATHLSRQGRDTSPAQTWGHGLVGFVRAAADHWLNSDRARPRQEVVADVTALFGPALRGTNPSGANLSGTPLNGAAHSEAAHR